MVKAAASGPGGVLPSSNYILTPQKRKRERLFLCRKKQTYLLSFCQINTLSFYQHRKVLYTYPRPEISNLANQPTNQLLVLLALWTLLTSSEFRKPAPKISLLFSLIYKTCSMNNVHLNSKFKSKCQHLWKIVCFFKQRFIVFFFLNLKWLQCTALQCFLSEIQERFIWQRT